MTEIVRDDDDKHVSLEPDAPVRHQVKGFDRTTAMHLFERLVDMKFAVSIKHLGGYYFVEVPVGLRGDPCFQQNAVIQTLASRAGCQTIQTGNTLRIIG